MSATRPTHAPWLSVLDYGAKGDGVADDTAAIAAALAAGLDVFFPAGTYNHSQPITLRAYQRIAGAGKMATHIVNTGTGSSVVIDNTEYHEIRDLELRGSVTTSHGVELRGASVSGVIIDAVRVYRAGGHGICGGDGSHVNNLRICNSDVFSCYGDGINLQYEGGQINAVWIDHCNVTSNGDVGIRFFGNACVIDSNTIQANAGYGVCIGDETLDPTHANQYCFASVVSRNYFEQNATGVAESASVIGIYTGYVGTDALANRMIRDLEITNNYFSESGAKYASIIHVADLKDMNPSSRASLFRTRSNYANLRLLTWTGTCPLSFGVSIQEDNTKLVTEMLADLPRHVSVSGNYTNAPAFSQPGTAAPTTGVWAVGNVVNNTSPAAGGYMGWVCVAPGEPGTWKGFGLIQS